jgi:DNA invertase Pin-like site-specific DNA recombinase
MEITMTVYAYARVSTTDQNVDQQIAILQKYNPNYSVTETFTGTTLERPKFNTLINKLKSGDTLIVSEVSRLGRKTSDVLVLSEQLTDRGVKIIIDNLGELDITSQTGKLLFLLMSGLAEMERETMLERQRIGIERAKTEGRYKGRKSIDPVVVDTAKKLIANGMTKAAVAKQLGIGQSTLYKYIK